MSQYTTELRFLEDNFPDKIMFGDYEIFSESYRKSLNRKIRDFYAFDEIGAETPARFCYRMRTKMSVIMPYYNKLLLSEMEVIDPFINMRYGQTTKDLFEKVSDEKAETERTTQEIMKDILNTHLHGFHQDDNTHTTDNDTTVTNDLVEETTGENSVGFEEEKINKTTTQYGKESRTDFGKNTQVTYDSNQTNTETGSIDHSDSVKTTTTDKSITSDTPEGTVKLSTIKGDLYAQNATLSESVVTPSGKKTDTFNQHRNDMAHTGSDTTVDSGDETKRDSGRDIVDKAYRKEHSDSVDLMKVNTGRVFTENDVTLKEHYNGVTDQTGNDTDNRTTDFTEIIDFLKNDSENSEKNGTFDSVGFNGITMSEMLTKWRDTFLNIDKMIIAELSDLFIGLLM